MQYYIRIELCLQLMPFYTLVGSDGMVPLQHPRLWRPLSNQIHWVFRNKSGNIVFQFILKSLFFFSDTVFYFCGCVYVFHLLWLSKRGYVNWCFKKLMFRFNFFLNIHKVQTYADCFYHCVLPLSISWNVSLVDKAEFVFS